VKITDKGSGSVNRATPQPTGNTGRVSHRERLENETRVSGPFYEVLTAERLAERWAVPPTWIFEQTRSRAADPIPHVRLGKYIRFQYGSPELAEWWERHKSGGRKATP
jgi:hypothetical protein